MNDRAPMKYGVLSLTRQINAPRELVYEAWTKIEHRRHWFVGPGWTEIRRSVDLKVNGQEVAHGRFADGTETIYTARFHLIDPDVRLIYAFGNAAPNGGTHMTTRMTSGESASARARQTASKATRRAAVC
jgi:uncharacterized protein YndB with AHSA1/START domain